MVFNPAGFGPPPQQFRHNLKFLLRWLLAACVDCRPSQGYPAMMAGIGAVFFSAVLLSGSVYAAGPSLVTRSPFLPPGFEQAQREFPLTESGIDSTAIEFRGVYTLGGAIHANLRQRDTTKSSWLQIGETFEGITLTGFDPEANRCTVVLSDGTEYSITLVEMPAHKHRFSSTANPGAEPGDAGSVDPRTGNTRISKPSGSRLRLSPEISDPVRLQRLRESERQKRFERAQARMTGREMRNSANPDHAPENPSGFLKAVRLPNALLKNKD